MKKKKNIDHDIVQSLATAWLRQIGFLYTKKKKKKMAVKANICEIIHAASITYFDHSS